MGSIVLTDARVEINAVDMSDWVTKITLPFEAEAHEDTAMGDAWRSRVGGGLKDAKVQIEWNQDFAAASTDALLWPLLGTSVSVKARPTSAAIAATNPEYQGAAVVTNYPPFGTQVGELTKVQTDWPSNGTFTRATA